MTLGGLEDELSNVILSGLVYSSCGDWSLAQTKVVTCRFGRSNILGALEPQNCSSFITKDISCRKLASDLRTAAIISTSVTPHTDEQTDTTKFCVPIQRLTQPFNHPSIHPSNHPTIQPSNHPTIQPSNHPTITLTNGTAPIILVLLLAPSFEWFVVLRQLPSSQHHHHYDHYYRHHCHQYHCGNTGPLPCPIDNRSSRQS